ncbi:MAG: hypothetical protein WAT64_06840 [Dokdonella sp.]
MTATIPVGSTANGIAASNNGARVFVANPFSAGTSMIDIASRTVEASMNFGAGEPHGLAITPDDTAATSPTSTMTACGWWIPPHGKSAQHCRHRSTVNSPLRRPQPTSSCATG